MIDRKMIMACLSLVLVFTVVAQTNKPLFTVMIQNKSSVVFEQKVVSISWDTLQAKYPAIDTGNLKIIDAVSKNEITYQYEFAGKSGIQNLLLQVNIKPHASIKLLFQRAKHGSFITKTYGRFVPERKDDFAWENDRIAFRMYGKALENTPKENAYGTDVWVKRTNKMVINDWYKTGDYHKDHGDGLDYYGVGLSLGAGSCMPYAKDSIWYSKNFTQWKLLDNGPLRTTFQLLYDEWDVAGKKVKAIKTISLDAGSQLNKITVDYSYDGNDDLPIVIGIVKRAEAGVQLLNEQNGVLGYWEPVHGKDGTTGVGCIVPAAVKNMQVNNKQLLAFATVTKAHPFVYYAGAVWDKAGLVTNASNWFAYLQNRHPEKSRYTVFFLKIDSNNFL